MASNNNPPFEYAEWFAGKNFTTNWATHNFQTWNTLLSDRRDESLNVLEIGSWEGRSALFFLNYFPHCHLTCIDTFEGSSESFRAVARGLAQAHPAGRLLWLAKKGAASMAEQRAPVRRRATKMRSSMGPIRARRSTGEPSYVVYSERPDKCSKACCGARAGHKRRLSTCPPDVLDLPKIGTGMRRPKARSAAEPLQGSGRQAAALGDQSVIFNVGLGSVGLESRISHLPIRASPLPRPFRNRQLSSAIPL